MPRPLSVTETRAVGVDRHRHRVGMAGQRLVDAVVDDLVDHVVQARAVVGIADIHAGPLANRLQALENLDRICAAVGFLRGVWFCSSAMRPSFEFSAQFIGVSARFCQHSPTRFCVTTRRAPTRPGASGDVAVFVERRERVVGELPQVPVRVGDVAGIAAPIGLERRRAPVSPRRPPLGEGGVDLCRARAGSGPASSPRSSAPQTSRPVSLASPSSVNRPKTWPFIR